MNTTGDSFPAKILLFGEYTILLGSSALSIPYHAFSAGLRIPAANDAGSSNGQITSNRHLFTFYEYLLNLGEHIREVMDFERFHNDLLHGLYFHSDIPAGYGLGSSGALVAAVFAKYAKHVPSQDELSSGEAMVHLKKIFSGMESFFHGRSSGFDPLVSFLDCPLLLNQDGVPEKFNLPGTGSGTGADFFLIDTRQTGKTAPLVNFFLETYKPDGKLTEKGRDLVRLTNSLIDGYLSSDPDMFRDRMKELSTIQVQEFSPMIPENFYSLWKEGAESDLFYLKICGSGGGGYLTGFTSDIQKATEYITNTGNKPVLIHFG